MKILILTRHAKSDRSDPGLADHDRPLNARGREAAPRIGRWIAQRAAPGEALVSTARPAVETFEGMAPAFASPPKAQLLPELYGAGPETMLDALRTAGSDTVLMIGHNPGIADFAAAILAVPPDDPDFARYPTAATLIARFDIDAWAAVDFGTGEFPAFTVPRRLGTTRPPRAAQKF